MKHYWKALFALIASALIYQLALRFVPTSLTWFIKFLWLVIMLVFGYFLTPSQKRNNRWLGKVVLAICVVFIFGYQLNLIAASEFRNLLAVVGLTDRFMDLLLIYCGWAFFQV